MKVPSINFTQVKFPLTPVTLSISLFMLHQAKFVSIYSPYTKCGHIRFYKYVRNEVLKNLRNHSSIFFLVVNISELLVLSIYVKNKY